MYSWYCFILNFVRVHKDDKEDMEMAFKEVAIESLEFMTASWGGVGIMWGKNIATAYIRPQRYTKKFMDETGMYTLSFLSEDYRKALSVCGSVSGKDVEDKWKEAGLHPYAVDGTTAVEEADLIFVCKTQYTQDMKPECFDVKENDEKWYPDKDYHTMYMGEIVKVLKRV